ncbi:collagenase [Clostridium weizhouense]|uniref:microbial collagenase n=1 Tax=Clostridium weizhouense TaxID=2859781 RepID=A0ABS7ALX7_9CLOT|nr:collagenase [Clostridium weizhouense]MBW6409647.1 collagenase [Clostridium weizhouense]
MKRKILTILCALALSFSLSSKCFASISVPTNSTNENHLSKISSVDEINSENNYDKVKGAEKTYSEPTTKKYSFKDLNQLSNEEIIELSSKISWKDISDIFKYNDDTQKFYSDKNRVQAMIDGLYQKASTFTATDDNGIDTLVEILRSGFYLGFYNDSLKYLKDRNFHDKCIPALIAMENNPNFKLGEEGQDKVVLAFGKLIGNASCNPEIVNKSVAILEQYNNEIINEYPEDRLKSDAVLKIMSEITYDINEYSYNHNITDGKNTPWSGKIDTFINAVSKFASITDITEENGWLINNGIYFTGKLAKYHSNSKIPHKVIDTCLHTLPNSSEQYITALSSLRDEFKCETSSGSLVDVEKILEDEKNIFLPKTYTFDDGKMIIKAGDKVSEAKIQRLYWASKEVKSQFHRLIGSDTPLEPGNADDVLTMVIYNNPQEYKVNRLLYGYSVDNGGIYIEGKGTFFTYERTPNDSIFSLEELFRHEYTHYLQGRYLVPGLFNQGDFYKGNPSRLTWFEEGSAEFFAGSTRNTILPRKSMVSGIGKSEAERLSANNLFHSSYSDGWDFYNYGYAFSDYMYNNNRPLFKNLVDSMKSNDVDNYDSIISSSSKDKNLDRQYQKHMDKLVNNYDNYKIPLVSDDYMKKCTNKSLDQIKKDIEKTMGLSNSEIVKEKSEYFNTYTLKSTYKLGLNKDENENWNLMNKKINETLEKLDKLGWNGYKTVTAYFINPKVNSYNEVEYDVVFHGLLSHNENFSEETSISLKCPSECNVGEKIPFTSECSTDNSEIVSYKWDFGDGNTSTEKDPIYTYKKPGNYTVKLTVLDSRGLEVEETSEIVIHKILNGNPVTEKEYNNDFENANKIHLNDLVSGNLQADDLQDTFSFEVTKPDDITITLESNSCEKNNLVWVLFNTEDTNKSIAFPEYNMNQLSKTISLEPGKYYLIVYQCSKEKTDYKFVIEGSSDENSETKPDEIPEVNPDENSETKPDEIPEVNPDENSETKPDEAPDYDTINVKEEEYNDDFESANSIFKNQVMSGNLDPSDRCDTYCFNALSAGTINVTLENTNSDSSTVNWLAFNNEDTSNYIGYASKQDGNKFSGSFKVDKPGKYYIVAYETNGNSSDYKLKVDGNIEKSSTSNDVVEDKNDDSFESANKITTHSTISDSLNGDDNQDIYCFDVTKAQDLAINLKSLDNLGVAWQLFSEKDLNNYISYGSKSGNSVIGNVNVTPGKYYLLVYKYSSDDGTYKLTIKQI